MRTLLFFIISLCSTLSSAIGVGRLPSGLKWETRNPLHIYGSPKAKKGGTLYAKLSSFPLTLRQVGPDANGGFRGFLMDNDLSFLVIDPNTGEYLPELASHWAFDENGRTVYYKIDKRARWSDGKPITSEDWLFTFDYYRSPHIVAPWYNQYYNEQIEAVEKFVGKDGADIVAVTLPSAKSDLLYYTSIMPQPKHFFKLDKDFVKIYNWKIKPNSGPYQISKVKKGKSITFSRKKNWWAKDRDLYRHRFNVDKVIFKVVRDPSAEFEYLKKAKLDFMMMTDPDYWHNRTNIKHFNFGYIHRLKAYNEKPRVDYVLSLNTEREVFKDIRVRQAFHYAMNVDKVINQVLRGDYLRLQNISQGYGKYTNHSIKARPFNLEKADALLNEAGWGKRNGQGIRVRNGKTLSTTISYSKESDSPRLVVLREEAQKAGIEISLKKMDRSTMWKSFLNKQHDIALTTWRPLLRPQYYGQYHSSLASKPQNNNFNNISDKNLDELIESYRKSVKNEDRIKLAHSIQQRIHDLAIQIPLFEVPYYRVAHWAWLKFPFPTGTRTTRSVDYFNTSTGGFMWIDTDEKKRINLARKKGERFKPVVVIDETYRP